MQADVDSGASYVGCGRALIQSRTGIGIAQQRDREPPNLQFMPQQPRESQRDILFGQGIGQGRSPFVAAVRGIDHGQDATADCPAQRLQRARPARDFAIRLHSAGRVLVEQPK